MGNGREGITWSRLVAFACDYSIPMRSSHRRHLLNAAREADALDEVGRRLLAAEELSHAFLPEAATMAAPFTIRQTLDGSAWILTSPDGSASIVMSDETVLRLVASEAGSIPGILGTVELHKGMDDGEALVDLAAGTPFDDDMRLRMMANSTTHASANSMALPLTVGLSLLALAVVASVGALRLTYSRLNLARLRSDLAATVSHELKTPVASTRVLVDTLLDGDFEDKKETREYLELIAKENFRLSRLIENFLLFSRIERGRLSLRREELDPVELTRSVMETMRERSLVGGRRLELQPGDECPLIHADREAIASCLHNLLENAVKHTKEDGGVIAVSVKPAGRQVAFVVGDNGDGIPREHLARIFEPFHRVDSRLSRATEGVGLGLNIVRTLVEAHGGRVDVQSDPGAGTTFTITLPAVEAAP